MSAASLYFIDIDDLNWSQTNVESAIHACENIAIFRHVKDSRSVIRYLRYESTPPSRIRSQTAKVQLASISDCSVCNASLGRPLLDALNDRMPTIRSTVVIT